MHLAMEFCEGGDLFDRIVARGHYIERAVVTRTIVEVVQFCKRGSVPVRLSSSSSGVFWLVWDLEEAYTTGKSIVLGCNNVFFNGIVIPSCYN